MGLVALAMWSLPGPGIEPLSPVLAGGFFPLHHQGSPLMVLFKSSFHRTQEIC